MRQTIRVDRLLRESVETPYSDLVTRSTGRLVRTSIQQALAASEGPVALLDFSNVGLVDLSCADEIIAKLLLDPPGETYLVLQGLREEQLEAIEHVLEHHDLAALVCDPTGGGTRPVGRVSPDLRTAFFTLQSLGAATVQAFSEHAGWTAARAADVLDTMVRMRLVRLDGLRYLVPLPA
jgi:hypothetical protein